MNEEVKRVINTLKYGKHLPFFVKEKITNPAVFVRGWGNGYVCVPKGHDLYEKVYTDIPIGVHGGWTFSEHANHLNWDEITEDLKDTWIIGFDTAHYSDDIKHWPKARVVEETKRAAIELFNYKDK